MDHLRRDLAPISDSAWDNIDAEARSTLLNFLAARAIVDFSGPKGWDHSSEPLGRVAPASSSPVDGVGARVRVVQPLVEMSTPFELDRAEIDRSDRGARDLNLDELDEACKRAALAEDTAIFNGHAPSGIAGIGPSSPHDAIPLTDNYAHYPRSVAEGVAVLRGAGVGGPYALALGSRCYTGVIETTEHGGYPVLEHCKLILGGPVLWAPAVDGAILLSRRGGDYELVSGEDFSIGYLSHTDDKVRLHLEESFTLLVYEPAAAVPLQYT